MFRFKRHLDFFELYKCILFLFIVGVCQLSSGQVTNEATPRGWALALKSSPSLIVLDPVDENTLLQEDLIESQNSPTKQLRFGTNIDVDLDLFNSGVWTEFDNGDRLWRIQIKSAGAKTMNVLFDRYDVPRGAELYFYNNDRTDKIGPYTSNENQTDGYLMSWLVKGDHLWLEYFEPSDVRNQGRISLDKIVHGYRDLDASLSAQKLNESGACNVDVMCDPNGNRTGGLNWAAVRDVYKDAVARIVFPTSRGTSTCTGTLINNVAQDGTPYFLTADHCLGGVSDGAGSAFNASQWAFGFQWFTNTPDCATFNNTVGPQNPTRVLSGASLRANRGSSDFALFQLNQTPPSSWNLYYAGWNRSATPSNAQLGIHHPSFDIMKLARNDQQTVGVSFQGVQCWIVPDWDYGVTEGGSSGSALIDINGHIVGQLYGGFAACSGTVDNGTADYYGRFDLSWIGGGTNSTRLSNWLNPSNSNVTTLNGSYASNLSVASQEAFQVNVYPNPSNGLYTVGVASDASYTIYNLAGQVIQQGAFEGLENQLNIANAANGLYFLEVVSGVNRETIKLVKE